MIVGVIVLWKVPQNMIILTNNVYNTQVIDMMNWDDMKMAVIFSAYHIGYCICFPIFHNLGDRQVHVYDIMNNWYK